MTEKQLEQLDKAVSFFLSKEQHLQDMTGHPYVAGGHIVATNDRVIIFLPKNEELLTLVPVPTGKEPDASRLFRSYEEPQWHLYREDIMFTDKAKESVLVRLEGIPETVSSAELAAVARFGRCVGIDTFGVNFHPGGNIILTACIREMDNAPILIHLCPVMQSASSIYKDAGTVNVPLRGVHDGESTMTDLEGAEQQYRLILQEEQREREEEERHNFKVFQVTLKRTASIAVKAKTIEEASRIAEKYGCGIYDLDFGDTEVDSFCESDREECEDEFDRVYDAAGKHNWEEYN